uniref:Uncharacterized protein n=1 Tax=Ciona savignyi TaxID=51511 RepID=H2YZY0_CIOSA
MRDHRRLTKRLLYSESSSEDENVVAQSNPPIDINDRKQPGYQDKVTSWLENVDPALKHSEINEVPKQPESTKESDLEDLVSISQVITDSKCKIVRRKKRVLSDEDPNRPPSEEPKTKVST